MLLYVGDGDKAESCAYVAALTLYGLPQTQEREDPSCFFLPCNQLI